MALTALIISLSIMLNCESRASAGVAVVAVAGPLAVPPACPAAIIEPSPNKQHVAVHRRCIAILLKICLTQESTG
jgi:hypothetical protein